MEEKSVFVEYTKKSKIFGALKIFCEQAGFLRSGQKVEGQLKYIFIARE